MPDIESEKYIEFHWRRKHIVSPDELTQYLAGLIKRDAMRFVVDDDRGGSGGYVVYY